VKPVLLLSFDKELVWGSFDIMSTEEFAARNPDPRGIVRQLLAVLDERAVPATWAVVGHLFLRSCDRDPDGRAHADLIRPRYSWYEGDWFSQDPCTDRGRDPLWYGDDIVEMIMSTRTAQEIASHSFSHLVYGDPGCSREAAVADVRSCVELAKKLGIPLRSFVFPRNAEGHHDVLRDAGFIAYRGEGPTWFNRLPSSARRAGHLIDQAAALPPPVFTPEQRHGGLWNLPGSMLLLPRNGVRRLIPLAARVRKARAGLRRAVREQGVFHLWFHPFNLATDPPGLLGAFTTILDEAVGMRNRGELDIRTMGDFAAELNGATHPPPPPSPG
jgi:peptidoglycan/xylan/chitin deacetylase (PgdA/CDA1 family)